MSYNFRLSFGAAFFIDFSSLISTERNWWGNLFPFALRILHHLLYGFIGYEENNAIFVKIGIKRKEQGKVPGGAVLSAPDSVCELSGRAQTGHETVCGPSGRSAP